MMISLSAQRHFIKSNGYSWTSLIAQLVKNLQFRRPRLDSWVRKICWRRDRLPTPVFLGFPGSSAGKESACNAGDLGLIPGFDPWVGKIPWRRELPTPVFWPGEFHGVPKSRTLLSDFHFHFSFMIKILDKVGRKELSQPNKNHLQNLCSHILMVSDGMLSPRLETGKISAPVTSVLMSGQCNQARKRNKRHPDWKGKNCLHLQTTRFCI